MDKNALRKVIQQRKKELSKEERKASSEAVFNALDNSQIFQEQRIFYVIGRCLMSWIRIIL